MPAARDGDPVLPLRQFARQVDDYHVGVVMEVVEVHDAPLEVVDIGVLGRAAAFLVGGGEKHPGGARPVDCPETHGTRLAGGVHVASVELKIA